MSVVMLWIAWHLCEHIGKSIFFDEFGVGVVTEIWNTTNFYVRSGNRYDKTCPLKCPFCHPGRIHLIIDSKELDEGYKGMNRIIQGKYEWI